MRSKLISRPMPRRRFLSGRDAHVVGFTTIELMIALAILAIITMIAIPAYRGYLDKADHAQAIADINDIEQKLERYFLAQNNYPADLTAIGGAPLDPWGNPYQYLNIALVKDKGKLRKDHNLVPINSDYDLYSKGEDGKSVSPLTARHSRDDIIRANNGGYIGFAEGY